MLIYITIDRYITMIKVILFCLALSVILAAPSGDKMTHIPVYTLTFRDTQMTTTLASIPVISMSKIPTDLFTTSSLSQPKARTIRIQLLSGSTEALDAAPSSVPPSSLRILTVNRSILPKRRRRLQNWWQTVPQQTLMAQYIKSALPGVPSWSRIFHQYWQSIRPQWCYYRLWQFVRSARFLLKVPWVQRSQILHRWRVIRREIHSWLSSADWHSQLCWWRDQNWYQRHHCRKWSYGSQNNQAQQIWIYDWSQICGPLSCPYLQKFMPNWPWFCRLQILWDWVQKGNLGAQPLQ